MDSFESVLETIGGKTSLQTLLNHESGGYDRLQYDGEAGITKTWIAAWSRPLSLSGLTSYIELDTSSSAVWPYAYIIPFAVVANVGVPLRLVVIRTERQESSKLYDQGMVASGVEPRTLHAVPLLSDDGKSLIAYAQHQEI
jgi:hypothetical protein